MKSSQPSPDGSILAEVRRVFAEVLKLGSIPPEQSFFAAGGDSFGLVEAAALLREALGVELTVRDIIAAPTALLLTEVIFDRMNVLLPELAEEVAGLQDDEVARALVPSRPEKTPADGRVTEI